MLRLVRWLKRDERGFTLVELLVVAAILAVLAGIAIPAVASARDKARGQAADATQASVISALERYYIEKDCYPDDALTASSSSDDIEALMVELGMKNATQFAKSYKIVYTPTGTPATSYTLTISAR